MTMDLNGKSILVTGGTGSFGQHFIRTVLERCPKVRRLPSSFPETDKSSFTMAQTFSADQYPALRWLYLVALRDADRLHRAFQGVDYSLYAAAMKYVPIAEYNPVECIGTNVYGGTKRHHRSTGYRCKPSGRSLRR